MLRWTFVAVALCSFGIVVVAQETYTPKVFGPSNEGMTALKRISVPKGMVASLVAAEPLLANPVAFCFDEQGNIYVAESFRIHAGVTDNRRNFKKSKTWLDDDLASRSVADREVMYKKLHGKDYDLITKEHERIRKLVDSKGTGVMDQAFVFADGFNTPMTGVGAGVLARQGKVYYTCIPDLWLLEAAKDGHKADKRKSLHYGYGIRTAYMGHDMHGLKISPDGRLYFSIGDRALHVETGGKVVDNHLSGAVMRCNLDGSELEIYSTGLRNPQELAFDQYGNLFTGDNNCDKGDKARWVHLVKGSDSGWRIGYQEMTKPQGAGPWNSEKVWNTQFDGQHADIVPPVGYVGSGPSGVTYNPGVTQLPDKYKEHFFMCDFRGQSGSSGIQALKLKPKGASFEFAAMPEQFVWSVLATDCDFGPDGGFYVIDWVNSYDLTGKGRIYKIGDAEKAKDPAVQEVKKLIAEGMAKRPTEELSKLLGHADMRVRQEAQFALVDRNAVAELKQALGNANKLPRLHGIWGLGMLGRSNPKDAGVLTALQPLLEDKDVDVRCQALKMLGDARHVESLSSIVKQLKANDARVRSEAAQALAMLGKTEAVPAIAEMLRDNADKDPYLRHAGVMALVGIGNREALGSVAKDASPAVRLASLLAMRRLGMVEVKQFLNDADQRLVQEAARAINDQPINEAMPDLAAILGRTGLSTPTLYRAINANFKLKKKENAEALARFAGRTDIRDEALRVEALDCLRTWDEPWTRDRVVGLYRPIPAGPAKEVADALRPNLGGIFTGPNKVRSEGAKLAAKFGIKEVGPALRQIVGDVKRPAAVRVESLQALAVLKDEELALAMRLALDDADPRVRTAGRAVMAQVEPKSILDELKKALDKGEIGDRQGALAILGGLSQRAAGELVESWLDKLLDNKLPPEVQLDVLEAAAKHKTTAVTAKLAKFEASRSPKDPLSKWSETLHGGDAENGKRIFLERSEVSCLRCHKVQGNGGDVGPDLTGIAAKQKRDYLLEAIVLPDKQIAQGYETVVITLVDGKVKTGILKSDDKKEIRLMTPEGAIMVVPVADVDSRTRGPSAMPADLVRYLSARDLRDLVEYMASLK